MGLGYITTVIIAATSFITLGFLFATIGKEYSPREERRGLVFTLKPAMRLVGINGILLGIWGQGHVMFSWSQSEEHLLLTAELLGFVLMTTFGMTGLVGDVVIDGTGITKTTLLTRKRLLWSEITSVLHNEQSMIRIESRSAKIRLGREYVALKRLLSEISDRTGIQPTITKVI